MTPLEQFFDDYAKTHTNEQIVFVAASVEFLLKIFSTSATEDRDLMRALSIITSLAMLRVGMTQEEYETATRDGLAAYRATIDKYTNEAEQFKNPPIGSDVIDLMSRLKERSKKPH